MPLIRNFFSRKWLARTLMLGVLGAIATGLALVMNLSFSWRNTVQAQTPAPTAPASSTPTAKPAYLDRLVSLVDQDQNRLVEIFKDIHQNPELGFMETRTAEIVAKELQSLGYEVKTGIGETGVVGILAMETALP